MRQRELSLHLPGEALSCRLQSDALQGLGPAARPASPRAGTTDR
jgi:hypothetical protein